MNADVAVLLASLALTIALFVFGRRRPGYSQVRQTISELGERGCPDGRIVSLGVFLPVGFVLAAIWSTQRASSPAAAALAGAIAVGYCGAAFFPCDPGSPARGSVSQSLHNLAGGVQYLGGSLALWRLGMEDGTLYRVLAGLVALAIVSLALPSLAAWRGSAQRVGEVALFLGLFLALQTRSG